MAGAGIDYSAHSCSSIISKGCSPTSDLTCPFLTIDVEDCDQAKFCTSACAKALEDKVTLNSKIAISKPSDFFVLSTSNVGNVSVKTK